MLPPLFFCRLEQVDNGIGGTEVAIASTPLPEGIIYRVTGYAQVSVYTLVKWQQGFEDEYATGENLWRGETPIATEGGMLQLYAPPDTSNKPDSSSITIWSRIGTTVGAYGVPADVAIALRDSANNVYF